MRLVSSVEPCAGILRRRWWRAAPLLDSLDFNDLCDGIYGLNALRKV